MNNEFTRNLAVREKLDCVAPAGQIFHVRPRICHVRFFKQFVTYVFTCGLTYELHEVIHGRAKRPRSAGDIGLGGTDLQTIPASEARMGHGSVDADHTYSAQPPQREPSPERLPRRVGTGSNHHTVMVP